MGIADGENKLYAYVDHNPLRYIDIKGLFSLAGNCDNCAGSGISSTSIRSSIQAACNDLSKTITDVSLRGCIKKSCNEGSVKCGSSRCVDPSLLGECMQGRFGFTFRTLTLCPNNIRKSNIGAIAIHEWAHGCGWHHGDGLGVPGNDGYL